MALIDANKRLAVAEQKLLAAKDLAAAIMAKGKADADVTRFANQAEAAGWQKSIAAFGGNGTEFARWTLYRKLAPAFRSLMVNTDNSPLMDIFKAFDSKSSQATPQSNERTSVMNNNMRILAAATALMALVVVGLAYVGFDWTVNRVYVPAGKSLLLRYKGPLVFTWDNKYANPGHFARMTKSA